MSPTETAEKKGVEPKSILPPDMDYEYFAGGERYPFEPENHEYSSINSWWLAEASHLSYCHPGFSRLACRLAGFHSFKAVSGKKAFCIAAWNDAFCIIAFRGTQLRSAAALKDLYTDLNAKPVEHPGGGRVHRGFLRAFEEIEPDLALLLTELRFEHPEIKIWVTGHSLGGALAALLYSRFPDCEGLYLFGAPRVGDAEFSDYFAGKPVFRIERVKDPIPRLPLDVAKLGFDFKDLGTLIMIRGDRSLEKERPKLDRQLVKQQISGMQVPQAYFANIPLRLLPICRFSTASIFEACV